ncbi:sorbose reductase sou1 [Dendrothele bispora CBS 962.96]|uniref:Sorbose reductase sou1 n=1 Tax=Dendrothele bispora (strain CBS 962.96) TaxID=1314807 RepID=A0A4S8L8B6_DENBC|nr:sorbose reductase sou1 [Dendrothele bispora CBS 962.96]
MMNALGIRASCWSGRLATHSRASTIRLRNPFICRSISTTLSTRSDGDIKTPSNAELRAAQAQASVSPLAPIGVAAAVEAKTDPSSVPARPKIFDEFALRDRVGIVSGGNRGLGLEMAMALCEAGARAVYCLDITKTPSEDWQTVKEFVEKMGSRLEYISVDTRDQKAVWGVGEQIGDKEGRMDFCVAAAGILKAHTPCLGYPEKQFREVMDINVNGVFFTAQSAGRQMERFGTPGSIILIASMSGSITNHGHAWTSYNSSKSAVIQMARSMACELAPANIRVNSLSPGHIYTKMTAAYLDAQPHLLAKWSSLNPMGRIGRVDEMRGPVVWLASDASSFCTGSDILVSGGHHAW